MTPLSFPPTPLSLRKVGEQIHVQCLIRKKWLVLTPEEWVRQHVIGYLVHVKNIPSGSISVEKALTYHQRLKRWDIATFDDEGNPIPISDRIKSRYNERIEKYGRGLISIE